ncbi:hypothetical protein KIPB_016120, partial [Kipferlia bialata]
PGVRIVVDSGLAKEARYDPERRMTLLEEVYVSKSSADQRKGRAGRTAPGYCLRLFNYDELERDSIQPEILRSSLDLVVLQLKRLGLDALTFPFLSRPEADALRSSVATLEDLKCLQRNQITERGKLFVEMPFDPRLSHFVVSAAERDALVLATEIAAIVTAPGSIFFMGGDKKGAKSRVAEGASKHQSDLLHRAEVYRQWFNCGVVRNGKCESCGKAKSEREVSR